MSTSPIRVGDPAPWFTQQCTTAMGTYSFDMAAGRYCLMYFFASGADPETSARLSYIRQPGVLPPDCLFFGLSADALDQSTGRLEPVAGTIRFFWDHDRQVASLFGLAEGTRKWLLVTPSLHIAAASDDVPDALEGLLAMLRHLPDPHTRQMQAPTPALILPNVFEPTFCESLITYYHSQDTIQSGFFAEATQGDSVRVTDTSFKRRRDCVVKDRTVVSHLQARVVRRVVPEIQKYFQFRATQMERMIISCYDSADRGFFGAHRDNTVAATAHRRFAVSINLNDDFEGGGLSFPEFGPQVFAPPAGGALVFSCSMLHAVSPVTRGRRYACLPFVYDDAGSVIKHSYKNRQKSQHST